MQGGFLQAFNPPRADQLGSGFQRSQMVGRDRIGFDVALQGLTVEQIHELKGFLDTAPWQRNIEIAHESKALFKGRKVTNFEGERFPIGLGALLDFRVIHGLWLGLDPTAAAFLDQCGQDGCFVSAAEIMLANQKCDVIDILSPVALAYGLLKQRTEFFSDKLMNGERTHRHTGPVQVQLLEGIDLITETDLDIKNPACLAVRQPGLFTCATLGRANADPGARGIRDPQNSLRAAFSSPIAPGKEDRDSRA